MKLQNIDLHTFFLTEDIFRICALHIWKCQNEHELFINGSKYMSFYFVELKLSSTQALNPLQWLGCRAANALRSNQNHKAPQSVSGDILIILLSLNIYLWATWECFELSQPDSFHSFSSFIYGLHDVLLNIKNWNLGFAEQLWPLLLLMICWETLWEGVSWIRWESNENKSVYYLTTSQLWLILPNLNMQTKEETLQNLER